MKIIAILLILLFSSNATESIDFFQQISKSDYGKNIIQIIQLELNTSGKVEEVINSLQGMLIDATNEKSTIQSNLQGRQSFCQSQQQNAQQIIDKANAKKADDERRGRILSLNSVPLKKEELLDRKQQSVDKDNEEQRNNDKLAALTQNRDEQKSEYNQRRDELIGFVITLQEAKKIVSNIGASFLQITMQEHYANFKEIFPQQSGIAIMVDLMLQTANQSNNPELAKKVVETIDSLIESIYDLQKEELLIDDQRESDYITQKIFIESANQHLAGAVASLRAAVLKSEQEILEIYNDIISQKQLVSVKVQELKDWVKTCNDEEKGFRATFENRNGQIEVLNEVLRIFGSGLSGELKKQISEIQIN